MRKRLSWWGTIKLFLLLITFALFIYIVFNVPSSLVLFNKLFLAVGLNILAAVLELLKVVKDEPQALMLLSGMPTLIRIYRGYHGRGDRFTFGEREFIIEYDDGWVFYGRNQWVASEVKGNESIEVLRSRPFEHYGTFKKNLRLFLQAKLT